MWQLLLAAAAAAGSTSLVAKYLFGIQGDQNEKERNPFDVDVKYHSHVVQKGLNASGCVSNCEKQEGIFRFSSPESSGGKSGSKILRKEKKKVKSEKRSAGGGVELSKRRAVAVCLKKRRTSKNGSAERRASSSKDSSLFNWGLGVGIMYMMSASKVEISKLNTTMDETAKVVQELKSELHRRKSSRSVLVHTSANEETENLEKISSNKTQPVLFKSRSGNRDLNDQKVLGLPLIDDGECTSSVLTEERDTEVLEMNKLEAELESELQKLPWYTTESSYHEDMKLNLHEVSTMGFQEAEGQSSDFYQSHGVSPSELDQKLSHLLIKQQENQIMDLESELHSAQSKLGEKENELQALKDCVKRLTEFSLSSIPGDEIEAREEQDCASKWDCSNEVELQSRPLVGMKRPVGTEYCNYYVN
ncbi:POLAR LOCALIZATION DURING ASYMMETRIC DIVISION AND protein [Citrus sinensis]|uniref:POLAR LOCALIZATION DURING ASYMMETRIC DIVISION AND protein n=1 Tax=Citrus sinensis TaxID=2711 RepID=A0ACB8JRZ2_CITSI|nr:POLAR LOCALIZATION DURING ASYMMETRIC DIVISION AND protein [Citrus sinensis]